jgi:hypothetical protein
MNAEAFQTIAVGDIISYTLSPHQRPIHPPRAYCGVVNRIDPEAQMVSVTLLDEEFEALNEPVGMDDIQSVAKPSSKHGSAVSKLQNRRRATFAVAL